jgi:transglutaminase-like putative cysteine protease
MQTTTQPRPGGPPGEVGTAHAQAPRRRTPPPAAPQPQRTQREGGSWFVLWPEDGLVTVLLAAAATYITIASIQSVNWAPGLQILTPIALIALVVGILAVQQRFLPNVVVHTVAVAGGCALALWLTARAVVPGKSMRLLLRNLGIWVQHLLHNQPATNTDDIFLLFIAALSFLLAYLTMWLVFHSRRPWLAVLANGVVLLINLNWAPDSDLFFLVLFLLAALLLLVRFTLADNVRAWRARHLRYSPDLNWDFLQAGAIFAGIVMLIAYLVPAGTVNPVLNEIVNNPNGVLQGVEQRWEGLFGGLNGSGKNAVSFFGSSLQLQGSVSLPSTEVLRYTSTDPDQYLITQTYDNYDGHATWTQSLTQAHNYASYQEYPDVTTAHRTASQTIDLTGIGNGAHNLFAAGTPETFSVPSQGLQTITGNYPVAWLSQQALIAGQSYTAQSYLSTATVDQLRQVPFATGGGGDFPDAILSLYLDPNADANDIAPEVSSTAQQWTTGTTNPYDAAEAIEAHLRTFTYSTQNGVVPANEDAVVWFLNTKKGFCTFFASTMALMMRSLGMPARIASGFSTGSYDASRHDYVERGTNLHVWTQVYFAGYGWINFEPTQTFNTFARPTATTQTPVSTSPTGNATGTARHGSPTPKLQPTDSGSGPGGGPGGIGSVLFAIGLSVGFLAALLVLLVVVFLVWWRALYQGSSPVAGRLARVARLGGWTGKPPALNQTPYEYADQLGLAVPEASAPVHELADLYVRERWGGQRAAPGASLAVYERARVALTRAIVRRWHEIPAWLLERLAPVIRPLVGARDRFVRRVNRLLDALVAPPD